MDAVSASPDTPRSAFALLSWRINAAVVVVLLALSALAWVGTIEQSRAMSRMAMGLGQIGPLLPGVMSVKYFLAMWATMMAAMMLPAVAPMALAHLAVARRRGNGAAPTAAFVASYLLVWTAIGVLPFVAYWGFEDADVDALQRWLPADAGAILIACGLYQFTGWKRACLDRCQSPLAFIMTHDFDGGIASAARAGAAHGLYCIGCCCALFTVLLVVGLMNLLWMAGMFLLLLAERNWKHGLYLAWTAGALFVVLGVVVIARPPLLGMLSSI